MVDPATRTVVDTPDVGARIAEVAGITKHAVLQRLPERVELKAILEAHAADDLSIAFAIGERHELGPVPIRLSESPGVMILGRQGCGKSLSLVAIGEAVMSRFSPEEAQLTLIDPKAAPHGLRDLHAPGYVRAYAYDQDEIDRVITELAQDILLPRLPPKGLSQEELRALKPWEGTRHFVLIDDVQDLRPAQTQSYPATAPAGAALWKLMERARQIGLHVFTTRNSTNWATLQMDPWWRYQTSAKVAQLYMDNDPQNKINRFVRAQALPPGVDCWSPTTPMSRGFWSACRPWPCNRARDRMRSAAIGLRKRTFSHSMALIPGLSKGATGVVEVAIAIFARRVAVGTQATHV